MVRLCDWRFEKKTSLRIKTISKVQLSFIVLTNHSQSLFVLAGHNVSEKFILLLCLAMI